MSQSLTQHDEIASQLTKFSTTLFQVAAAKVGPSENVLISPFSVAVVLAMTHVGATGNTASQLKDSLQLSLFPDEKIYEVFGNLINNLKGGENFTLESANQMYVDERYPLTEKFQATLQNNFGSPAQNVDFVKAYNEARLNINKWVEEFTRSKIQNLLPEGSLDSLTKLVLVNALYFKGDWLHKFNPMHTSQQPFYLGSENNQVDVPMMFIDEKFRMGYIYELDSSVLELPYKGEKLSMFIILPNKIDGLSELEGKLSQNSKLLDNIDEMIGETNVMVHIPKFKIETSVPMKGLLVKLGIVDLFSESLADLSGISGRKGDLYCSEVYHKCFIEVNEEGSEAAAATAAVMQVMCMPPRFLVDHPALFFIRDNGTKLILFIGRLSNP